MTYFLLNCGCWWLGGTNNTEIDRLLLRVSLMNSVIGISLMDFVMRIRFIIEDLLRDFVIEDLFKEVD